ncbi:MAG: DUF3301 domain-containing protein [Pseudomonadota bacterium]
MLGKFLLLGVVVGIAWFWWRSQAASEFARKLAFARCKQLGLQFLDDSVSLQKIWLSKNLSGQLQFCRIYAFEFSSDGVNRLEGSIKLYGNEVRKVELPPYPEPE